MRSILVVVGKALWGFIAGLGLSLWTLVPAALMWGMHGFYGPAPMVVVGVAMAFLHVRGMPVLHWRGVVAGVVPAVSGNLVTSVGLATGSEQGGHVAGAIGAAIAYIPLWRMLLPSPAPDWSRPEFFREQKEERPPEP